MSILESYIVTILFTTLGAIFLWFGNNPQSAILSLVSLVSYAFVYTPLKRKSSISVFVGAFPGAMPPLLGWLAATGYIGFEAILLFTLQFIWQFPHFWAIAWRLDEDYKKAGFFMMPIKNGSDKSNAFVILFYTLILIPLGFLPYYFGFVGLFSTITISLVTLYFSFTALLLYQKCDMDSATKLMFASFIYLPVMQLAWLINF
jgi:protoheme IX farnesyltransferase